MRPVRKSLALAVGLALTLALTGGPWLALQTVAWTGMLVRYSQADGLLRGIAKTFDGQHPCQLCTSISKATADSQKDEDGQSKAVAAEITWLAVIPRVTLLLPATAPVAWSHANEFAAALNRAPPLPPPRA